jgi:hypothetical protein
MEPEATSEQPGKVPGSVIGPGPVMAGADIALMSQDPGSPPIAWRGCMAPERALYFGPRCDAAGNGDGRED